MKSAEYTDMPISFGDNHLRDKLIPLPFSVFYFINWYYADNTWLTHLICTVSFIAFLFLFLWRYQTSKGAFAGYGVLLIMTPLVSIINPGANCFAIFACAASAHTLKPKLTYLLTSISFVIFTAITWWMDYGWMTYYVICIVVTGGVVFTGLSARSHLLSVLRERADREEMHRLSKLSEHNRIGQDMHDLLGHSLTGIHLKAKLANKLLERNDADKAKDHLNDIEKTVQKAMSDVRRAVLEYKSLSLQEELIAQKEYIEKLGMTFLIDVPDLSLPTRLENDLVMLIREAINNTLKYAGASRIKLSITETPDTLNLVFSDNGKGIQDEKSREGSGLDGMRGRIKRHGGNIEFMNQNGLWIRSSIPLLQDMAL